MGASENIKRIRIPKGVIKNFIEKNLGMSLQGHRYLEGGEVILDVERMKKIETLLGADSAIFFMTN